MDINSVIDTVPYINKNIAINYSNKMTPDEKINYLVQNLRLVIDTQKRLRSLTMDDYEGRFHFRNENYDILQDDLKREGKAVSDLLRRLNWEKKDIIIEKYDIANLNELIEDPDSQTKSNLKENKHSVSIVTIGNKKYIVDCAYRQFFSSKYSIYTNSYFMSKLGTYMLQTEKNRQIAEQILKYGFIEATPENLKKYIDAFIIISEENEHIETPSEQEYVDKIKGQPLPFNSKIRSKSSTKDFDYIIDSEPYIEDDSYNLDEFNESMSDEKKITSVVQKERKYLMRRYDLTCENLSGECRDSAERIILDCTSKGFTDSMVLTPSTYLDGVEIHNCTIANLNKKSYLIDCTYRQFFTDKDKEKHCGIYMLNNEKRKEIANQLLKKGWIEATPENLKAYMDGFEMAKRKSFEETGISAEEYMKIFTIKGKGIIHIINDKKVENDDLER